MRRILLVSACLGLLVLGGATTAMARGPHHRHHSPAARYGPGYRVGPRYDAYYYGRGGPYCGPYRRAAVYPAYPVYGGAYAPYPRTGFGVAGRNFSFWYQN